MTKPLEMCNKHNTPTKITQLVVRRSVSNHNFSVSFATRRYVLNWLPKHIAFAVYHKYMRHSMITNSLFNNVLNMTSILSPLLSPKNMFQHSSESSNRNSGESFTISKNQATVPKNSCHCKITKTMWAGFGQSTRLLTRDLMLQTRPVLVNLEKLSYVLTKRSDLPISIVINKLKVKLTNYIRNRLPVKGKSCYKLHLNQW